MDPFQKFVFAIAMLNFIVFIAAGKYFFDASKATAQFSVFVGVFTTLFLLSMSFLYGYGTQEPLRLVLATGMLVVSMAVFLGAFLTTIRSPFTVVFSPDAPTRIVTSGIYKFMRHPFYVSYIWTFFAVSVATSNVVNVVCAFASLAMYIYAAKLEENKFAQSELAGAYAAYRARTGMFFPRVNKVGP